MPVWRLAVGIVAIHAALILASSALTLSNFAPAIAAEETGAASDTTAKLPRPLKRYKGRRIAPTMTYHGAPWLTRTERAQEENTAKLLDELHVKPGMAVCDMGCGNGYYTLDLAQQVGPSGKMFAVDIQPEMLHLLAERAKQAGIENIEPIENTPIDPKLPEDSCDLILLVDVYHEFAYPVQMLRELRKALKPQGRIALVEFRAEDLTVPIKPEHKMSKRQILKEFPPNGFRLVGEFDGLPWQHLMFFGRDPTADGNEAESGDEESNDADSDEERNR